MKLFIAALALLAANAANADTSVIEGAKTFGTVTLKRGSTTVSTFTGTQADCRTRAQVDAAGRANGTYHYTCAQTETDAFDVTKTTAPPTCAAQAPADTSKTISCSSPYFGTRQVTQGWTMHPTPQCWVNDGAINPPSDSVPPCSTTPPTNSYTTTFAAAENPISEGGMWSNGKAQGVDWNNVQSIVGRAYGATVVSGYNDDIAVLTTLFSGNQYAQGTIYRAAGYSPSANHETALYLRMHITAHSAYGYEILWGQTGELNIVRWNGPLGNYTPLGGGCCSSYGPNIGAAVDGDVLRAEASGSTINVWKDGALVLTTDLTNQGGTVYSDGQPGMGFWPQSGATPSSYGWKNYTAGSLP